MVNRVKKKQILSFAGIVAGKTELTEMCVTSKSPLYIATAVGARKLWLAPRR